MRELKAEKEEIMVNRIRWEEEKATEIDNFAKEIRELQGKIGNLETRLEAKRLKAKKWKAEAQTLSNLSKALIEPPSFEVSSPFPSQLSTEATQVFDSPKALQGPTTRYLHAWEHAFPREMRDFSPIRVHDSHRRTAYSEIKPGNGNKAAYNETETRLKREIKLLLNELLCEPNSQQMQTRSCNFQAFSSL
jgi:hypothetical protein